MLNINYDPESMDSWFSKMPIQEQLRFNSFIEELSNPKTILPERYHGEFKRMNETFKLNANPSLLSDEQLYLMDQQLVRTYYDTNVMARVLAPVTEYMPNPRWVSEHYTITGDTFPEFSKGSATAFRTIKNLKLGVEPTLTEGVGGAIKWTLPFTLIKEGADGVYNPDFWHNYKAGEIFGKFWDERLCLGTAGENTSGDLGITGVHNYSGLGSGQLGTGDNTISAAGDYDIMIRKLLGGIFSVYEPGNNVIISTSGVGTELFCHDSTYTDRTDIERIQKKYFDTGLISAHYIDNNIEADTNATNTARAMILRIGPSTCKRQIIYPLQKKPLTDKEFEDDVAYAIIQADVYKMYNASAGYICNGDMTTTSAGIIQNGLFMTGRDRNQINPMPTYI